MLQFGIDLGGTKTEIIALDEDGNELLRRRSPTPRDNYPDILNNILTLVHDAATELNDDYTLGIGIPGALSYQTSLVKNANTTCLIGEDLKGDIERALNKTVVVANDADCLALSEATDGAGAGFSSVFAVIVGTGCGGGWVINGQLVNGPNAIAGEWGHNPLPWRDEDEAQLPCYCGQKGCLETLLSGTGIRLQAKEETGKDLSAEIWVEAASRGDSEAQEVLQRHHRRLAKALAAVINIMDPHVIVLGGGVSNIPSVFTEVPKLWSEWVFSDTVITPLRKSIHGDSSGVRGAAWLGASL